MTALINTFDHIKRLKQAGFSHQAAEAQIEVIAAFSQGVTMQAVTKQELDSMNQSMQHYVKQTKTSLEHQIKEVETCLHHKIDQVESRLENKIDKIDVRLSHVEKRVETLSANMKWAVGISLTYLTVVITFVQFIKH